MGQEEYEIVYGMLKELQKEKNQVEDFQLNEIKEFKEALENISKEIEDIHLISKDKIKLTEKFQRNKIEEESLIEETKKEVNFRKI